MAKRYRGTLDRKLLFRFPESVDYTGINGGTQPDAFYPIFRDSDSSLMLSGCFCLAGTTGAGSDFGVQLSSNRQFHHRLEIRLAIFQ